MSKFIRDLAAYVEVRCRLVEIASFDQSAGKKGSDQNAGISNPAKALLVHLRSEIGEKLPLYGDGQVEIAERVVDHAQCEPRADLRLLMTKGIGCGQSLLSGLQRSAMLAGHPEGDCQLTVNETEPAVVAQRLGQQFRIRKVPDNGRVIAERDQRVQHHEAKIDARFGPRRRPPGGGRERSILARRARRRREEPTGRPLECRPGEDA